MAFVDNQALVSQLGQKEQSGFMKNLLGNTELLSIVMDMIGSKLDPENPFAGVGSTLARSSLAAKAEEERKAGSKQDWSRFMEMITGKDQAGPTTVSLSRDPSGAGGLQYNITGLEEVEKRMEETTKPVIRSSEEFIKDFSGGF
jgi:hypothetical protein